MKLLIYFFIQILELLQGKIQTNENKRHVEVKEEIIEEEAVCNNFSNVDMKQLADILDKTGGWKKLAEHMGHGILVPALRKSTTSPSITLLNYINVSLNDFIFRSNRNNKI